MCSIFSVCLFVHTTQTLWVSESFPGSIELFIHISQPHLQYSDSFERLQLTFRLPAQPFSALELQTVPSLVFPVPVHFSASFQDCAKSPALSSTAEGMGHSTDLLAKSTCIYMGAATGKRAWQCLLTSRHAHPPWQVGCCCPLQALQSAGTHLLPSYASGSWRLGTSADRQNILFGVFPVLEPCEHLVLSSK